MTQEPMYSIRDMQGNVYGPATAESLRQWTREGRIVAGMHIAPENTNQWQEASTHPIVGQLLRNPTPAPAPASTTVEATRVTGSSAPIPGDVNFDSIINAPRLNVLGLLSFIFACLSFPAICCCFLGFPFSIVSIALGLVSLNQYKTHYGQYHSKWMPITGVIISIVTLLLTLGGFAIQLITNMHK